MFEKYLGNITTRNIPYDSRLRAGFNMLRESENGDLVFPERYVMSRDENIMRIYEDEYKRCVKEFIKLKSSR